jgi:thioredoxin 1
MMPIQKVTRENYQTEVLESDKLVILDFYADWCGPCRVMMPELEKFAADNQDKVRVMKVNVDEMPELAAQHNVRSIPTLWSVGGGKPLARMIGGVDRKKMENFLAQSLQLAAAANINKGNKPPQP